MKRRSTPSRPDFQTQQARAQEAARLLARGEAAGIAHAIEKAARGVGPGASPSPLMVLHALAEYQRLFEHARIAARTTEMRGVALEVMEVLAQFAPRLHGAVLYGTPVADTRIGVHLHSDETEAVGRFLLDRRVPFQLETAGGEGSGRNRPPTVYACERRGVALALTVLPLSALRQRPRSMLTGGPAPSLDLEVLRTHFERDPGGLWLADLGIPPTPYPVR